MDDGSRRTETRMFHAASPTPLVVYDTRSVD